MSNLPKVSRNKDGSLETHPVLGVDVSTVFSAVYEVEMRFRERIEGGQPKDPATMEKWLETRGFTPDEMTELVRERRAEKEKTKAENGDAESEEEVTKSWSGFLSDETGLYIEGRQLKAMFRECATEELIVKDNRGFRQRLQHGFFTGPHRIYLLRDGKPLTEPDGYRTKVVHTWAGGKKIAAFSRHDYVNEATIVFSVSIVRKDEVKEEHLRKMLVLAEELGIGANRSQGEGKVDVIRFERVR